IMNKHRLMISMIQSSAVTISVCVSNDRYLPQAIDELSNYFRVEATEQLEILTVRGPQANSDTGLLEGREVVITQHSQGLSQYILKASAH
ncbi:MAG: aspartate kinase, partial [Paludibacter sp.]|nr:aspartate kinase [Paludibacter sp.]